MKTMVLETLPKLPPREEKKSHKVRTAIITLFFLLIIVFLVLLGMTGLYQVPVLSSLFGTNKPRDLGIHPGPEAFMSLQPKFPLALRGEPTTYSLAGNLTFSGTQPLEAKFTSEESTAFLQKYLANDPLVEDVQIRMIEDGLEISSMAKKPIRGPIYVKTLMTPTSSKSLDLTILRGEVGRLSVPRRYLKQFEEWLEATVNRRMAEVAGFSLERLAYHDGFVDFKGTFPKTVEPAPGQWLDLPFE